jgi:hypothetical protein
VYVERTFEARSSNHFIVEPQQYNNDVVVVNLHVTVNYVKILIVAQQCFNAKFFVTTSN